MKKSNVIAKFTVISAQCCYTKIAQRIFKCGDMQQSVLLQMKN